MTTLDGAEELALYETCDVLAASAPDADMLAEVLLNLAGLGQEKPRGGHGLTVWTYDHKRVEQAQHIARRWLRQHGYLPEQPGASRRGEHIQVKGVAR